MSILGGLNCTKTCPGTPLTCCLRKDHEGNHKALGKKKLLEPKYLIAEWIENKIIKISDIWK